MRIGRVLDSRIKNGYRKIKYLLNGRNDVRETVQCQPPGIDSVPIKDQRIIHGETGTKSQTINIGICDNENRKALEGEIRLFALNSDGELIGEVYLKEDSTLQLMEGEDWAVRYTALAIEFNELQDTVNNHISNWNTFAGAYVAGGPATQGAPLTISSSSTSSADITTTKVDEINLP